MLTTINRSASHSRIMGVLTIDQGIIHWHYGRYYSGKGGDDDYDELEYHCHSFGDRILQIDGKSCAGLHLAAVRKMTLGPVGSIKKLKCKSTSSGEAYEREVTITSSNVQK
jgi:hypothetical protein